MSQQIDKEELAIRYLLGGLSEEERTNLEERFFADDKEFEELEIAEGELIDRYVRKELSSTDQRQFYEMLRTSPRLVERVEFARILAKPVPSPASPQDNPEPTPVPIVKPKGKREKRRPWRNLFGPTLELSPAMRIAFVAPLALLLLTSVALAFVWTRLQNQSERLAAEQQRLNELKARLAEQQAKNAQLEGAFTQTNLEKEQQKKLIEDSMQEIAELRRQSSASIFPFLLNPGGATRGGGGNENTVKIPAGTRDVELQLNVESGNYSLYQASLTDIDRKVIAPLRKLKPVPRSGRKVLTFRVPASRLRPERTYSIHVDGLVASGDAEDFADYSFRVTNR